MTFDPQVISFKEILELFFSIHDPTTMNQQGADIGTQYRSAIFCHNPEQQKIAEQVIDDFNQKKLWDDPIVTQVTPLQEFYRAEDYHQEYFLNNVDQPYCRFVVAPKVAKFRKQFLDKLKKLKIANHFCPMTASVCIPPLHSRQDPRSAVLLGDHLVCLRIIDNLFCFRIPVNLLAYPERDIS